MAIKVLPAALAQDPERLARFEREAKVLASLNHPNIAQIYGIEESGPDLALVMELVPGETLQTPLPRAEALRIAVQIAEALEAAHEKGIIHRDLKPANIMITPQGVAKVLDFGLAAVPQRTADGNVTNSPTLTMQATQAGMIMGTAGYMSPEQASGQAVDKRADIWSFGVVLWEMLTGQRLFTGNTVAHILADVLRAPIDLDKLPKETPRALRNLLKRCLDRDVKTRLRDIGEARVALTQPLAPEPDAAGQPVAQPRRSWPGWLAAGLILLLSLPLAFVHFREAPPEAPMVRATILPPENTHPAVGVPILSPDGRRLVFGARDKDGKVRLFLRQLSTLTAQPLSGTENVTFAFWSPDSNSLGFFADGKLKTSDLSGDATFTVCECVSSSRGGTWNQEGVILFQPIGSAGPLMKVAATGGTPVALQGVEGRWPWFLPDGRHFLFTSNNPPAVRIGSLDSKETRVLLQVNTGAVYAQGFVLYLRDDTLVAQPFNPEKRALSGDPAPLAQNILVMGAFGLRGAFSLSQTGLLAYQPARDLRTALTWFDRNGKKLGEVGQLAEFADVRLSPDGKMAAATIITNHSYDVWLIDLTHDDLKTRFTFTNTLGNIDPLWSPDGASIIYQVRSGKQAGIYRKAVNMAGSEEYVYPTSVNTSPTPVGRRTERPFCLTPMVPTRN